LTAATRAEAEKVFGEARRDHGIKTLSVVLPTGAEVGTISIKAGGSVIRWHGAALADYVEATAPTEIVETVDPAVLADPELVLWVLQHRPHMVRREVRDAYRTRLARELTDDGELVDPTTGERSEEHTSELQSRENLVCRLLLEKKKSTDTNNT